ncbi:MAG TPA: TetR/AcrR family transcriptional regulator [Trebonia sp.]|jgi:AcrR family transcriptional regulator|nr:TetR/AcrR family transcriptional regulator [Trebonia sp.]
MIYRDTRRALIDAAAEVIGRRGVEGASTREIYQLAGVTAPTLYHHFGDKQGLLDAVVTDAFERYLATKRALPHSGDPAADARRGWDTHVAFAQANPELYQLMWPLGQAALPAAAAESAGELEEAFTELGNLGYLRPGMTPRHAARTVSSALRGVTAAIIREPDDPGNQALSATVRDAVIDALLVPVASRSPATGSPAGTDFDQQRER